MALAEFATAAVGFAAENILATIVGNVGEQIIDDSHIDQTIDDSHIGQIIVSFNAM